MSDPNNAASIDPSEVAFLGMAILMAIALVPRVLRFFERRGWFKR
jgi:hypothetical protein